MTLCYRGVTFRQMGLSFGGTETIAMTEMVCPLREAVFTPGWGATSPPLEDVCPEFTLLLDPHTAAALQ